MPAPETSAEFVSAAEPHRRELLVHCYQMMGSVHEAQDVVQETMVRAWQAYGRYDPTVASLRTWLYRIATNACLSALEGRARRPLPSGAGPPFEDPDGAFVPGFEVPWLEPFPDRLLPGHPDDPEAVAVERSRLRLALVAALQLLPARQRAALILRDVLGFSAAEAAELLGTSVAAVNSSLQRARAALDRSAVDVEALTEPDVAQRAVVDAYVAAFARADVAGLTRLLAADVVLEMPPMWNWYVGPATYGRFMTRVFASRGTRWRTLPASANGQPAVGAYNREEGRFRRHTLQVFTVERGSVTRTTVYQDGGVFDLFALPSTLD